MKTFLSLYTLKLPFYLVYMLQQVEYKPKKLTSWMQQLIDGNKSINTVMTRQSLVLTKKARALVILLYLFSIFLLLLGAVDASDSFAVFLINSAVIIVCLPYFLYQILVLVTYVVNWLVVKPIHNRLIRSAKQIFHNHTGIKIAVIGSYGKTTMKELLSTVLSESKQVATTPGNMNTAVSHARFSKSLSGEEEVLIVEFGEGEPGDVKKMAEVFKPDYAVITGLAPNHLDEYPSIKSVAEDLLSIKEYVDKDKLFVTSESQSLNMYLNKDCKKFSLNSVMGWKTSDSVVSVAKTIFTMKKGKKTLHITSGLIGRHQIAPLAFVAAFADYLGTSTSQIEKACATTTPHEHRMYPRFIHGAWLIDDTYNGNIEGMIAGLKLLGELDMKRKWYVTPGLVDQGSETYAVHNELGKTIAAIQPDIVVLMDNSARPIIQKSMEENGFSKELRIEKNPLEFYTSIEHVTVAGDVVLMQNDWTDNYN